MGAGQRAGSRLSLAVSSPGGEGRPPRALLLRDVPALAADRSGDAVTLAVALSEPELSGLLPLLPDAEVYVLPALPPPP